MTYKDLQQALAVFDLTNHHTFAEIKDRYRELVKCHHPDRNEDPDQGRIRAITAAFRILEEYCTSYRFSFTEGEYCAQHPEELLLRQFADDPIWGGR